MFSEGLFQQRKVDVGRDVALTRSMKHVDDTMIFEGLLELE